MSEITIQVLTVFPDGHRLAGKPAWAIDGCLVPVVAGGDGPTLTTKLDDLRAMLAANLTARATKEARIDEVIATVEARTDQTLTPDESTEIQQIRTDIVALDAERVELKAAEAAAVQRAADRQSAADDARALPTKPTTAGGGNVDVRSEERTYRPGGQNSFFADLYARQFGHDRNAEDRLYRHEAELQAEHRDTIISGLGGMVPPVYLVDKWAPVARAGRPLLNALNRDVLPNDGVSFFIPRATTVAVGGFVTEGASFIEVDSTATTDNTLVQLVGAYSDISRTVFMRGGSVADDMIFRDLIEISEVAEDASAIVGTSPTLGFSGLLANVPAGNKVAYTDGTPTVPELWPKISDAIQRINSARFLPATAMFMHPRRWGWITSALDTTNRPLFNFSVLPPPVPFLGLGSNLLYGQIVGTLQGLPVITDANIPTTYSAGVPGAGTEDVIIIARTPDIIFMEDDMMRFTMEQAPPTAPGQVRLAAGRFAFLTAARYPSGLSTVSGTGLVAPVF